MTRDCELRKLQLKTGYGYVSACVSVLTVEFYEYEDRARRAEAGESGEPAGASHRVRSNGPLTQHVAKVLHCQWKCHAHLMMPEKISCPQRSKLQDIQCSMHSPKKSAHGFVDARALSG